MFHINSHFLPASPQLPQRSTLTHFCSAALCPFFAFQKQPRERHSVATLRRVTRLNHRAVQRHHQLTQSPRPCRYAYCMRASSNSSANLRRRLVISRVAMRADDSSSRPIPYDVDAHSNPTSAVAKPPNVGPCNTTFAH